MRRPFGLVLVLLIYVAWAPVRADVGTAGGPGEAVGQADASEIDLPAFIATIDALADVVDRADPRNLTAVLLRIPSRMHVRNGDQHFVVPLEPLAQALPGDPALAAERLRAVHRQLVAIGAEARMLLAAPPVSPDGAVRTALGAVLARKEFARRPADDWLPRLREQVGEWLSRLWERIGGDKIDNRQLAKAVVWLSTLSAVGALLFWSYRRSRVRTPEPRLRAQTDSLQSARTLGASALAAIRAGQPDQAVRLAYRASVTRLEEQGIWRTDDSRTAREYLRLLSSGESRRQAFADIAAQFERVFYGHREITADDLARLAGHLETLGCLRPHEASI